MKGYRRNRLFVARKVEGQGFLVPVSEDIEEMRRVYRLNDLGWFVWQNLDRNADPESLASLISRKYGIDRERASADLTAFLEHLLRAGAIHLVDGN